MNDGRAFAGLKRQEGLFHARCSCGHGTSPDGSRAAARGLNLLGTPVTWGDTT